jgi:hypothetical protein
MPKPIPFPTVEKPMPDEEMGFSEVPEGKELNTTQPEESKKIEKIPTATKKITAKPEESKKLETTPEESSPKEEMPSDLLEENCVVVDGQKIEIKPTKLKYFRNKAASAYGIIKAVPLHELLTYGKGQLDEKRDADQLLYDFLVSVFDDSKFVRDHYDNMDADMVDRCVKIVGRLNHIDEKEEAARKNREAQAQQKR